MTLTTGLELMGANRGVSPLFNAPFDDPDDPLKMIKGGPLTMVRATTATYLNHLTGLITSVGNNILRIEANGALIEGQRTNLAFPSTMETGHATGNIFGVSAYPAVDTSSTVSPDGSTDAVNLTFPAGATRFGTATDATARHIPDQNGNAVISLWMRSVVGTVGSVTLSLRSTITPNLANITPTLTTEWQRVSKTRATVAGQGTTGWYLYNTGESEIEVWGANFEAAAFASSYIPTVAAAVTRNLDKLTVPSAGNVDAAVGTYVVLARTNNFFAAGNRMIDFGDALTFTLASTIIGSDGSVSLVGPWTHGGVSVGVGWRWGNSVQTLAVNGTIEDTGVFDGDLNSATNVFIGDNGSGARPWWGHLKNFQIFDVELSSAQMIAKTS